MRGLLGGKQCKRTDVSRPNGAEMAMVEGCDPGLPQPLGKSHYACVDDAETEIGVGALQLVAASQVVLRWAQRGVGAFEKVFEKHQPGLGGQALVTPVVELAEHQRGDEQVFAGLGQQGGTAFVVGVRSVKRRQQDAGVKDEGHLRERPSHRLARRFGGAATVFGARKPYSRAPRLPDRSGLLLDGFGEHGSEALSPPARLGLESRERFRVRADRGSTIHDSRCYQVAVCAFLGFALLALTSATPAHATYDPVGSGTTKLTLDRGFVSFLKKDKIKLLPAAGASKKGSSFVLPVMGGNLDTTIGKGEIDQGGTLVFQGARKKVPWKKIVLRTKSTPLIAKVGGSQLKIATSRKLSSAREGFGTSFSAKQLKLTAKVATRLNKKLRPKIPFFQGQLLGTVSAKVQPRLTTILAQGKATLAFDEAFVTKMDKHFVSINPIFPAEHQKSIFSLPIIGGGSLAPDGSEGELRTGGEIEFLQLGAGQVFWREQWLEMAERLDGAEVDVEPTPAFPGKLGRLGVLRAAPFGVASNPSLRTISASNVQLTLTAQTAQTFNEAFAEGKEDFKAGEVAGALSFTAQGQ
jgi:hypothetical protein